MHQSEIAIRLQQHVEYLATAIGERNPRHYQNLEHAREYIEKALSSVGYGFHHDVYQINGQMYRNVIAEKKSQVQPQRVLVIGAHYDTVPGTPGADDNASGTASLLEIARLLEPLAPNMTVRLVAFTLEEPPYFRSSLMGSLVHARKCRERNDQIVGMISLEMVGYYTDRKNSQAYPLPLMGRFYPNRGNFIAVAGNFRSRRLVRTIAKRLAEECNIPVESAAIPFVPGVGLSDNWSFWQQGYSAVMITDTSFFRNPHYHLPSDLPRTLDYQRMAVLVSGLAKALTGPGSI